MFGHLHCHTMYSDGYGLPENMIAYAKEIGLDALAITDHGTLGGTVHFVDECKNHGIKPIIGNEMYFRIEGVERRFHITVLSHGQEGYKTLITLNNLTHQNMEKTRMNTFPILNFSILKDVLKNGNNGITILTGCPASAIHHEDESVADFYVRNLIDIVGKDNVYAELMAPMIGQNFTDRPLSFVNKYDIKPVFTNDCHLIRPEDSEKHLIYMNFKKGYTFDSGRLHLMRRDELFDIAVEAVGEDVASESFKSISEIIEKTPDIDLSRDFELPDTTGLIPALHAELLESLSKDILKDPKNAEIKTARLKKEWAMFDKFPQFWRYLALTYDLMNFAKQKKIYRGVRGSAAGCYLLYLLDISQPDPIKYGLMFERFINSKRLAAHDVMDIDIDVDSDRRHEIQEYAKERWKMLPVMTYNTLSGKSLIRGLARGIEKTFSIHIPDELISAISANWSTDEEDEGDESSNSVITELLEKFFSYHPLLKPMYDDLLQAISHRGKHACALVSLASDIDVPLESWSGESQVAYVEAGWQKSLAKVGGVKMDLLGLSAYAQLAEMQRLTGVEAPKDFEPGDRIFDNFKREKMNLVGLFQFSSSLGQSLCELIEPNSIEELSDVTALGRPGPLQNGFEKLYANRSSDLSSYPDEIRKLLEPTRGVMIYQETIAQIVGHMQYPNNETEGLEYGCKLLKDLVPKSPKVRESAQWQANYKKIRSEFIQSAIDNHGYDEEFVTHLFDQIEKFIGYAFNKSHSISYALIAAQMSWYLTYYPGAYFTAMLNKTSNNKQYQDRVIKYLVAAAKAGAINRPPHINYSSLKYEYVDGDIVCPLSMVKGLGDVGVTEILNSRDEKGEFLSLADFSARIGKRSVNRRTRRLMYDAEVFSGLEGSLKDLELIDVSENTASFKAKVRAALGFALPDKVFLEVYAWAQKQPNKKFGYVVRGIYSAKSKAGNIINKYYLDDGSMVWQLVKGNDGITKIANRNNILLGDDAERIMEGRLVGFTLATDKSGKSFGMIKDFKYID